MEENTSDKIAELNRRNIEQGGQSIHEDAKEDIEAVKTGNKTVDMVERLMSENEIVEAALKNNLYSNMLAPCLAANISLNGKLIEYLSEPMRPNELEDNVANIMHVILEEISREPNGLVFYSNGSINVRKSIAQSVTEGMPPTALLRETIDDRTLEKLQNKYEQLNQVGLNGMIRGEVGKDVGFRAFEELFAASIYESYEKNDINISRYNRHKRFEAIFDIDAYSPEEKQEKAAQKEQYKRKLEELQANLKEKVAQLEGLDKNSKEYFLLEQDISELRFQIEDITNKYDAIGSLEVDSMQELAAKEKTTQLSIAKIFGSEEEEQKRKAEVDYILENGTEEEKIAVKSERLSKIILKNLIIDDIGKDHEELSELRDKFEKGLLSEEEKQEFAVKAIKAYYKYNQLCKKIGEELFGDEKPTDLLMYSKKCMGDLIPGSVYRDDKSENLKNQIIDDSRLVEFLSKIEGYEDVTIDNFTSRVYDEITQDLSFKLTSIYEARLLDVVMVDPAEEIFNQELLENNDKDYIINGYNILRKLSEKGSETSILKMTGKRISMGKLDEYIDEADNSYEAKDEFYENKIDEYIRNRTLGYFKQFKECEEKDALNLFTNEENAKILSAAISGYKRVLDSRKNDEISNEVKDKSIEIIKHFLGDVVRDDGTLKEEDFVKAYIDFSTNKKTGDGKYRLKAEEENFNGVMNYHSNEAIYDVERMLFAKISATVKKVQERNEIETEKQITNEEAKKATDEKGEELDDSATKKLGKDEKVDDTSKDKLITKEEGDKAMTEKGENLQVADLNTIENNLVVDKDDSLDKSKEESGNEVKVENIDISNNKLINRDNDKKSFLEKITSFINTVKDRVSKFFNNNSSSTTDNNNASTSSSNGGTNVEKKEETNQIVQTNQFGQNIELNLKDAQNKTQKAKENAQGERDDIEH